MENFGDDLNNIDQQNSSGRNDYSNKYNNNKNNWKGSNGYRNFPKKDDTPKEFILYKPYVVTGNKDASSSIIEDIKQFVIKLEDLGYTTRSGGMDGIDSEVESVSKKLELYLPWRDFSNKQSKLYFSGDLAKQAAKKYSPVYDNLKPAIQSFLAKNARMVLGDKLNSNCLFLICWSEDGAEHKKDVTARTGNVGHVILIANSIGVPVFNLGKEGTKQRLQNYISMLE